MKTNSPGQAPMAAHPLRRWLGGAAAVAGVVAVALLLLLLAGTFHRKTPAEHAPLAERPVGNRTVVEVREVERQRVESAVGTVKPIHEVSLASKLLARVLEVKVTAGQAVRQGELLVRLDDTEQVARVKQLEARLLGAQAAAERAAAEAARVSKLRAANVVSQAEFEQAEAGARTTAAEVTQAMQALAEARALLAEATLVAPRDGVVVDKRVQVGDTVLPGQVVLTMYDPTHMQLVAAVRESLAARLRVGQTVGARLDSLDYQCAATVSEIVPESQAATRSFLVKVTGPCPPGVYSGLFGRLEIPLENERVTLVPAAAVRRVGQLELVDVVDAGMLRRRAVVLGRQLDGDLEVLAGLHAGERVALPPATPATGPSPASPASPSSSTVSPEAAP